MKKLKHRRFAQPALTLGLLFSVLPGVVQAAAFSCPAGTPAGTVVSIGPFVTGAGWSADRGGLVTTYRNSGWYNPAAGEGSWISPPMGTDTSSAFTYTLDEAIVIDPAVINVSTLQITGRYGVDNYLDAVQVTPASQPSVGLGLSGSGFSLPISFSVSGGAAFQSGSNQLSFVVRNAESTQSAGAPMGFWADFSLTAECRDQTVPAATAVPVDAPWALASLVGLLGAAGAAYGLRRRKKQV